jgi:hypothetical protein
MKLIYTNLGILTEDRVRELKECGYEMEECGMAGSYDDQEPLRMGADYHEMPQHDMPAKIIVVRGGLEEDVLEEGDTSSPADGGSVTGTQVAVAMPNGPAGAPSPSGGAVVAETFNRRAEALLEAWLEEEKKSDDDLEGDQDELDVAPPFGKLTGADFKTLGKKAAHKKSTTKKKVDL